MAEADLIPLPPREAIAAFKARGGQLAPTFSWEDAWQEDHARSFTVAKSTGFDILNDIYSSLEEALKEGKTVRDFAKDLTPVLQAKGWWGKKSVTDPLTGAIDEVQLGSPRRLQTIFDTNMRVSYATGHWAQFERSKALRPYLRYVAIMDGRTRPAHAARHNVCLPVDDPYWDHWAPPCGWRCRCTLQSLSQRDVDRMGSTLKRVPPPLDMQSYVNKRTGVIEQIPAGIDPGWGYNPGKAGWKAASLADPLAGAPPQLAAARIADKTWPVRALATEFSQWFDQAAAGAPLSRSMWTVGAIDQATLDGLTARGVAPRTGAITIQMQVVQHMMRAAKAAAGKTVPTDFLRELPLTLSQAKAVLLDKQDPALVYVFDVPGDARLGKLVVRVNFQSGSRDTAGIKRQVVSNEVRTAGMVQLADLANTGAYEILSGSL
ncbi:phage head morphogenesis protein [Labrys neptuniae]|uniref:Phage minor head protein n=1 Tax=Labrys neptuniae TaxID=376174 RepID=A0ABV3PGH5_9HYPH